MVYASPPPTPSHPLPPHTPCLPQSGACFASAKFSSFSLPPYVSQFSPLPLPHSSPSSRPHPSPSYPVHPSSVLVLYCGRQETEARRGGAEVAGPGLWIGRSGFDSRHTLTACGPSDGKEVKDVFGRPGACVGVGSAC